MEQSAQGFPVSTGHAAPALELVLVAGRERREPRLASAVHAMRQRFEL
jgi:hypothetical protein